MSYGLSKSRMISGRQCVKRLFLEVHQKDLAQQSDSAYQVMSMGEDVQKIARSLYPHGRLIDYDGDLKVALDETNQALQNNAPTLLFEATFGYRGVLIRADLLFYDPKGSRLVEVKGATSLKDYYLEDCAIQAWVIESMGIPLKKIEVALVNSSFVYREEGNYDGLLYYVDVTDRVRKLQPEVPKWVQEFQKILTGPVPEINVGAYCTKPFACPFLAHCSGPLPEYPVTCLPGRRRSSIAEKLMEQGILDIRDIPEGWLSNLTHEKVRRATITGKAEIDPKAGRHVRGLPYPRYYLDFETIWFAVPIWLGTKPYRQIPFQWSCHIEESTGDVRHEEFLDTSGLPPMRPFAEKLISVVEKPGPIIVYSSFEKTVLNGLAEYFPDLEVQLRGLIDRLEDFLPLTRGYYYHPQMKGTWSIKAILPTIDSDLNYDDLEEVSDGQAAQRAYMEIINPQTPEVRRQKLRQELFEYCKLDTLAMVKLAHYFQNIS